MKNKYFQLKKIRKNSSLFQNKLMKKIMFNMSQKTLIK